MLVSANQPFNWNWVDLNDNPGLVVMGTVYDDNNGNPIVVAQVLMVYTGNGMYTGQFQGVQGHNYSVQSSVYTDETFQNINPAFPPGGESFQCATIASQGGGGGGGNVNLVASVIQSTRVRLNLPQNFFLSARVIFSQNIATC